MLVPIAEVKNLAALDDADRYFSDPTVQLYAVMDGQARAGYAADVTYDVLAAHVDMLHQAARAGVDEAKHALQAALGEANNRIYAHRGCGGSVTACIVATDCLVVAHIGDSRLYYRRSDAWIRITREHSLVEDARSNASPEALAEIERIHANVVTRLLGFTPTSEAEFFVIPMQMRGQLLLCTDGAWRPVEAHVAGSILPSADLPEVARWILQCHRDDGERDNATVLIAQVYPEARAG